MIQFQKIKAIREDAWALIILLLCLVYLFTISLISEGLYGDTDSIAHYHIARFAFKYPWFLVHHWGKPLFTTLSAPFAQFGLQGSIFFNILCGLLSAWLIYRIAKELKFKYALAAIPFSLFAPVYMVNLFTSLTEILFGLVLVAGIYCFLKQKSILSAIIISFIPFARTEGVMFLIIFLFAFILVKKFKAIPFLFTGFIIYGLAGYFHYHKFLWFFSAMPYTKSELYGSGSFWYYLERFHQLLGFPLTILAVIGVIYLTISIFRENKPSHTATWLTEFYLIPVSLFGFILAHSFLWWQGMMGVLASPRFMACIMPLCGFLAIAGLNFIYHYLGKRTLLKNLLCMAILGLTIYFPYRYYQIPKRLSGDNEVMKESADALMKIGYADKRVIYLNPKLAFYLHTDPFNKSKMYCRLPDKQKSDYGLADSSFLIWDTQFGEYVNSIILDDMLNNPNFRLIDGFVPKNEYKFLTGQNYMALIFQKVPAYNPRNEWIMVDSLDFETAETEEKVIRLTDSVVFSGNKSNRIDPEWNYSFSINKKLDEISLFQKVILRARIKTYIPDGAENDKFNLVLEVRAASGEMFRYIQISGSYFKPKPGKWFEISLVTPLQTDFPKDGLIKLYVWYSGKNNIFVDDMVLEYLPVTS